MNNSIVTAENIMLGATVEIISGTDMLNWTVKNITDTVNRETHTLEYVTIDYTNGNRVNYLPDTEFRIV